MNQRDASRKEWRLFGDKPRVDEINAGSFQRIADAVERMTFTWQAMRSAQSERDELRVRLDRAYLRIRALRGVITRAKRRAVK